MPSDPSVNQTRIKAEDGLYRVVHSPSVMVRAEPGGRAVGGKSAGDIVRTDARTVGGDKAGWVRLRDEKFSGAVGWMLLNGSKLGLGVLLEPVGQAAAREIRRYRIVASPHANVCERPHGPPIGQRAYGRVVRCDLEVDGWARLQADFYKPGCKEPVEGWLEVAVVARAGQRAVGRNGPPGRAASTRWEPSSPPASEGASVPRSETSRMWIVAPGGAVVRERPWGRLVGRKPRGALLRIDAVVDGWARLEEDFLEEGGAMTLATAAALGFSVRDGEEEEVQVLEGWVLIDGRDLGLPRQLSPFANEAEAPIDPPPSPDALRAVADRAATRRAATMAAEAEAGCDTSIGALVREAGLPEEVACSLREAGVPDLPSLICCLSVGDLHAELKRCGVGKLGQRQKLSSVVAPYWASLALKEQGNALYRASQFEEAAARYSAAIEGMPCGYTELALACYSNRAACLQQMREPEGALQDTLHVLRYDPANPKAVARRKVYEQAVRDT